MGRWRPACADGVGGLVPSLVAHLVEPFVGLFCGLETSTRGKRCGEAVSQVLLGPDCPNQPTVPTPQAEPKVKHSSLLLIAPAICCHQTFFITFAKP